MMDRDVYAMAWIAKRHTKIKKGHFAAKLPHFIAHPEDATEDQLLAAWRIVIERLSADKTKKRNYDYETEPTFVVKSNGKRINLLNP